MSSDHSYLGGRHIRFNVNLLPGPLIDPATGERPFIDIERYVAGAKLAESALVDSIFLADALAVAPDPAAGFNWALDPLTILPALARETSHIGLIASASTTYSAPYALARSFLSLDHVSAGRAGWNIVTTMDAAAAANFGSTEHPDRAARYRRADEFTSVVTALWLSWQPSASSSDRPAGTPSHQPVDHHGEFFNVSGPMQIPSSQQGMPVLFQAGGSDEGLEVAARHADGVFTVGVEEAGSRDYRTRLNDRAQQLRGTSVNVLPGLGLSVGSTEAEVKELIERAEDSIPAARLQSVAERYGLDLDKLDLDEPLSSELFDISAGLRSAGFAASVGFARGGMDLVRAKPLTLRRFIVLGGGGHRRVFGTPESIADDLVGWVARGAADGFNVSAPDLPQFAEHVVPVLQQRGVHRREYSGSTLREHIGQHGDAATVSVAA